MNHTNGDKTIFLAGEGSIPTQDQVRQAFEKVSPPAHEPELTWDELSKPEIKTLPVVVNGVVRHVRYFSSIPMDRALAIHAAHANDIKNGNRTAYTLALLAEVMVEPECKTPAAGRAAMRANSGLISKIIVDVTTFEPPEDDVPKP